MAKEIKNYQTNLQEKYNLNEEFLEKLEPMLYKVFDNDLSVDIRSHLMEQIELTCQRESEISKKVAQINTQIKVLSEHEKRLSSSLKRVHGYAYDLKQKQQIVDAMVDSHNHTLH